MRRRPEAPRLRCADAALGGYGIETPPTDALRAQMDAMAGLPADMAG